MMAVKVEAAESVYFDMCVLMPSVETEFAEAR
jgi:hypothetical protein